MIRPPTLLIFALSAFMAISHAQEAGGEASSSFVLPDGPLLRAAPSFSLWTITFTYPDDQKDKDQPPSSQPPPPMPERLAARPRTIVTTKTGEIIHEEISTITGNKSEDWQVHGDFYIKYPGKTLWSDYAKAEAGQVPSSNTGHPALPPSGFRNLDWITKENFAGRMKTERGDCLIFVPGGHDAIHGNLSKQNLDSADTIAYVAAETRLPVMVRTKTETQEFKFDQAPTSTQVLPDDLTSEIKVGDAIKAKRNAAPAREY